MIVHFREAPAEAPRQKNLIVVSSCGFALQDTGNGAATPEVRRAESSPGAAVPRPGRHNDAVVGGRRTLRRTQPSSRAQVRLVAQPSNVAAARRFVDAALAGWGRQSLADDIGLCVSELTTNATLHSGGSYFHLEVEEYDDTVRVAVADPGMGAVDQLARQPDLSDALLDDLNADDAFATGRGMFLVSALAHEWGIDELPSGKRVWAEFRSEGSAADREGAGPTAAYLTWTEDRTPVTLDRDDWAIVRFRGCPADLLIAHDANLAEYVRELQLIGDRLGEPSFQRLAQLMGGYVADHAPNWDPARIIAHEALQRGRELVDIDVLADRDIRGSIRHLRQLIGETEALSLQGRLMTLPAPHPVQRLRDWLEGEFLAQIEDGAPALSYPDWLAGVRH
jgi:anti-sigma regulatory factor (Ser/Thr protein kinase)